MASKAFLILILVAMVVAPSLATDYKVGDDDGWKIGFNSTTWTEGKKFYVGDTLRFVYAKESHNVLKVSGDEFKKCAASSKNDSNTLTSGDDLVPLAKPGKKWYICGFGDHCSRGMKLVINVLEVAEAPAPTPTTPNPTPGSSMATPATTPLKSGALILAALAVFKMFLA